MTPRRIAELPQNFQNISHFEKVVNVDSGTKARILFAA